MAKKLEKKNKYLDGIWDLTVPGERDFRGKGFLNSPAAGGSIQKKPYYNFSLLL